MSLTQSSKATLLYNFADFEKTMSSLLNEKCIVWQCLKICYILFYQCSFHSNWHLQNFSRVSSCEFIFLTPCQQSCYDSVCVVDLLLYLTPENYISVLNEVLS